MSGIVLRLLLGALDAPLDLPDVIEILVKAHAVARRRARPARLQILGDEVEKAPVGAHPGRAARPP